MISPPMGIAFWLGLFWRRATTAGAWASTLAAFGTWMLTEQGFFLASLNEMAPTLLEPEGGAMRLHWQMIFYLATGFAAGIVVSLLTPPVDPAKLERFYELVRTPVDTDEGSPARPCTLPAGVAVAPRRLWFGAGGLEIPRPGRTTVVGFVVGWIAVVVLIWAFRAITR